MAPVWDGRGRPRNGCGSTPAETAVAIAAGFRGGRPSYIIAFSKTMELPLTQTLTRMDFRATAGFAESAVAVAADFCELVWYDGSCHGHNRGTCCGDCRGIPRTYHGNRGGGNGHGSFRETVAAIIADFRGLLRLVRRILRRTAARMATTVAFAVKGP